MKSWRSASPTPSKWKAIASRGMRSNAMHRGGSSRQAVEQLAQKSRLLEATFDSLDQGILSVDANGRCNAWNRRFIALVQIPESLMQQHPLLADVRRFQLAQGHFGPQLERNPELAKKAEQIKDIARVVERTRMAELSRDHTLKQQLTRSQGLGLSR